MIEPRLLTMDHPTALPHAARQRHAMQPGTPLVTSPDLTATEPCNDDILDEFSTAFLFATNGSNATATANATINVDNTMDYKYIYVPTLLVVFCAVSVMINIKVLASAYWIKRPLSPTLHISLSLAGADAFASFQLGLGLFINSLLDKGLQIEGIPGYIPTIVEVFRLGGVIITVAHLLALAVNHYLGIIKPLHYPSIMTHRNRSICIVLMWIIPITFILVYFSAVENQGFQSEYYNVTE